MAVLAGMASYLDAGCIVTNGGALVLYKDQFGLGAGSLGLLLALLTLPFAFGALIGVAMLYVATIIVGFSIGADLPVSLAMIAEEAPPGAKARLVAFSHVLWMIAIGTVLATQAVVGGLGVLGGRIMWLHLLIVAVVVLVLRSTMPESKEWTAAQERVDEGRVVDAAGHHLNAGAQLLRKPFVFPLIALGLFYGVVNLSANTGGQFATLMYTELAGVSVSTAGVVGLAVLGISFLSALMFMRIIERPNRMTFFFLIGGILYIVAQILPLVFGVSLVTLIAWQALGGIGGAFAGEPMWKIWSQELFPTLLRSSGQGVTVFFTRVLAAVVALARRCCWNPARRCCSPSSPSASPSPPAGLVLDSAHAPGPGGRRGAGSRGYSERGLCPAVAGFRCRSR